MNYSSKDARDPLSYTRRRMALVGTIFSYLGPSECWISLVLAWRLVLSGVIYSYLGSSERLLTSAVSDTLFQP